MDLMAGLGPDQLAIDFDSAKRVAAAFTALREELDAALRSVSDLGEVKGMGTLKSGQDLAAKFSKKAVGGEDSLEKALKSHVQVVTEMRDFFLKCLDSYSGVDTSNAVTLAGQDLPGS
ncbi:hypothetical protein [Rhodococcus sp. NPDC055024]